jgi:cardiolipin synthase
MRERYWTISNGLSVLRAIVAIPVAFLVTSDNPEHRWGAFGLIAFAALTDYLDGRIARQLNQVTEFGRIIDPIADKLGVGLVSLLLTIQGRIPVWFLIAVLFRDVAIIIGGAMIKVRSGETLPSNWAGKWTVTVLAAYLLVVVLDMPALNVLQTILLAGSVLMLALSFVVYLRRFLEVIRNPYVQMAPMADTAELTSSKSKI